MTVPLNTKNVFILDGLNQIKRTQCREISELSTIQRLKRYKVRIDKRIRSETSRPTANSATMQGEHPVQ